VLVFLRDGEVAENEREDEDIVRTQGKFDEITGEELQAGFWSLGLPDPGAEAAGERDPDAGPGERLAEGNRMRLPVKDTEVESEHEEHEGSETKPEVDVVCH